MGQSGPSAGWASAGSEQRPPSNYRDVPPGWSGSAGGQRPSPAGRDLYSAYQDWAIDAPETRVDAYTDAAPPSSRSQPFRGSSTPMYQPGGQPWQQQQSFASAPPAAYPGSQQGYGNAYGQFGPLEPEPPRRGKKTALIALLVIVLLAAVGGGAAYLFLGSKPTITVTSKYSVGATPAGAATTTLQVSGAKFTPHSAVSFLIDGQPEPGQEIFQSDANGAIQVDLTVTSDWPLGQHSLTAKDASGNTTLQGKTIAIVTQGEAGTPGPKGAPADNASFTFKATLRAHYKGSSQTNTALYVLVVTGQPDPAGGTVCDPGLDTNQPHTDKGTSNGVKYTETYTATCSGTYKDGKISYKEMLSNDKLVFSNGVTCTAPPTYVNLELDGSFTSATDASGAVTSDTPTITCSNGRTATDPGLTGTWAGSIAA
jgi:hypothetical protein